MGQRPHRCDPDPVTTDGTAFDELVSELNYPMFIVTVAAASQRSGCLVGFATQASISPQRMLVMISKRNHTYEVAKDADALAIHFLHEGNRDLATLFGEATGDDVDKFALSEWSEGPLGVPILHNVRGWASGPILSRVDGGDHVGHLVDVTDSKIVLPGTPLRFQSVRDMEPGHEA
jgi:flavin reductase (DIM6/NTAB) family NADH-FMN oxidoreductase RutF